jgi:hypothetical protein
MEAPVHHAEDSVADILMGFEWIQSDEVGVSWIHSAELLGGSSDDLAKWLMEPPLAVHMRGGVVQSGVGLFSPGVGEDQVSAELSPSSFYRQVLEMSDTPKVHCITCIHKDRPCTFPAWNSCMQKCEECTSHPVKGKCSFAHEFFISFTLEIGSDTRNALVVNMMRGGKCKESEPVVASSSVGPSPTKKGKLVKGTAKVEHWEWIRDKDVKMW